MKTTHLVVILGAILWPAARYDVSAADYAPQVSLTGEGAGGQIYYQNGFPGVQLVRIPNLEEDVAAEAQTSSPVVREAAALNGFYRMSVDLPAGIVAVSAVAPTYAYAEAYLYNNWYWANMDGSAQAHVNDRLDQVTVFGPFDAGAMVPCVIR
ncbi:MAG: hypothetical protein L6Q38_18390, partial [Nitrospira sp.]|nr:hypothetical protein [Nitrospira sp.]